MINMETKDNIEKFSGLTYFTEWPMVIFVAPSPLLMTVVLVPNFMLTFITLQGTVITYC